MATLNHSTIIKGFEDLKGVSTPDEFFFGFLKALKFSAATIKRLLDPKGNRNVASVPGDFALSKQIYFHPGKNGEDLQSSLRAIVNDEALTKHQIRFYLSTDFKNVVAYDRRVDDWTSFAHEDLRDNYEFFLPLTGLYEKPLAYTSHPADVKACEKMGKLYDVIRAQNHYDKEDLHDLNVFLTRLLFCFFAEDTGIFPIKSQLTNAIESLTQADGSDTASFFERLFWILDCEEGRAARRLETPKLAAFPYVNGGLFREKIRIPDFNAKARNILLECGRLEWNEISPVIFGSMFQAVMDPEARRELGAHYTSEKNIFKVIGPLFLDDLKVELEKLLADKSTHRVKKLKDYQSKLASLKFLDPACGCGNFLIVTYRELKKLELEAVKAIYGTDRSELSLFDDWKKDISKVSISQFYGIELEEFPVDVARVSMWLMEHVMNRDFSTYFGQLFPSIPLKESANIFCQNALRSDWAKLVDFSQGTSYIFGNPPFNGSSTMTSAQKEDLLFVADGIDKAKSLDLVSAWYLKSAQILNRYPRQDISCAYVSTNSVCQGELVFPVWSTLISNDIHIIFAHSTFCWANEAKNSANVFCVIIGFAKGKRDKCKLFTYETAKSDPKMQVVPTINPYLIPFRDDVFVELRSKPLAALRTMARGNQPSGKAFFLSADEKEKVLSEDPAVYPYIKRFHGAEEFLQGSQRYCYWFVDVDGDRLMDIPSAQKLIEKIRAERRDPKSPSGELKPQHQGYPLHLFRQITQPDNCDCLLVPCHSSERRKYIPMGYVNNGEIIGNSCQMIPQATLLDFGIMTSNMHMTWMRTVCGRLKSDYRYSRNLCYNTFPWPKVSEAQRQQIENLAQNVLMTREFYPDMTLADLYDPDKMPEDLKKAHHELDLAVERLYRKKPFASDEERLAHLFARYEKLVKGEDDASLFNEE